MEERVGLLTGLPKVVSRREHTLLFAALVGMTLFAFFRWTSKTVQSSSVVTRSFSSLKKFTDIDLLLAAYAELVEGEFNEDNFGFVSTMQALPSSSSVLVSFSQPDATVLMRFDPDAISAGINNVGYVGFEAITDSSDGQLGDPKQKKKSLDLLKPVLDLTQADILGDVSMAAPFIAEKSDFFGIQGKDPILKFKKGFLQGEPPLYTVPFPFQVDLENNCVIYDYVSQISGKEGRGTDFAWVNEELLVQKIRAVRHGTSLSSLTGGETKPNN